MGKLAGLLGSGIGLAVEASSAYRSPNRSAPETRTPSSNGRERSSYEPPPSYEEYPVSNPSAADRRSFPSEKETQDDERGFQESQRYPTYGASSESVYEEDPGYNMYSPQLYSSPRPNWSSQGEKLSNNQPYSTQRPNWQDQGVPPPSERSYSAQRPNWQDQGESLSPGQAYSPQYPTLPSNGEYSSEKSDPPLPSQSKFQSGLADPVIIPQRRPGDRSRGWTSAYAPSLQDCGIDQATFVDFLESFNEASRSSAALDAVNVAAFGVGFAPGIAPMIISMVVPAAVRVAKTKQTESGANSFLTRANRKLFAPHGLFAMVMTFKPSEQQLGARDSEDTSPQLPPSAPLVFLQDRANPASQSGYFRQVGHFVADYGDRRAQAKYAQEHQDTAQVLGPAPSFRSRWGDPNNAATNGSNGLKGLVTGQVDNRRSDKKDRKRENKEEKKRRKGPGLIGGVRGMITEKAGMKQDQGLIKGMKNMGMQTDLLYLIIVNNPGNEGTRSGSSREDLRYHIVDGVPR